VKLLVDIPLYEKVFARNILGVVLVLPVIIKTKTSIYVKKEFRTTLFFRCLIGLFGLLTYYYALDNMILSDATMINKLNPFFVILFSYLFLKEELKGYQVVSIIFAFMGAMLVIKPSLDFTVIPALIALLSAVFAGASYTLIRGLSGKVSPLIIVFYFSLFTSIVTFFLMLVDGVVTPNSRQLVFLILMALAATLAQIIMTFAYKIAEASRISVYNYASIIFALIITYTVFADSPDIYSIFGGVIIVLSGIFNFRKTLNRS